MYPRSHVAPLRVLIAAATLTLLSACSNAPTAPSRTIAVAHASHDDTPPDAPCAAGWQVQDGRWVCPGS